MEQLFLNVFNVTLPVLLCAAIGFWLAKIEVPFDNKTISSLVAKVGYPTLIISHLSQTQIEISAFLDMMAAAVLTVACFGVLGFIVLKVLRFPVRAFLTPMMHVNVGNIGLPITLLALGDSGMAYAMAFVVVVAVSIFTVGAWIPAGQFSFRSLLQSPVVYALVLTLILISTGTALPTPIAKSLDILGGMSIPLMLLTLGHTLATFRVNQLGRATLLTFVHLSMAVAVATGLVWLFGFTGTERAVLILCCLMPSSVATYLFIDEHQPEHAPEVAGFILVSTLATILVLPLALSYWI